MANIVELRAMSDDKLRELLENGREELFNLRFQKATAQLDNHARVKTVRREVAQLETVLHLRDLAIQTAAAEPEIARQLADKQWQGFARYDYEESAWEVTFSDVSGDDLATAWVNLNRKRVRGRRARARQEQPQLVIRHEIA